MIYFFMLKKLKVSGTIRQITKRDEFKIAVMVITESFYQQHKK